jgi:hypothetical protein
MATSKRFNCRDCGRELPVWLASESLQPPAEGGRYGGHESVLLHPDVLLDALPQFRERGLELRVTGLQTPQRGNQGLDLLVFLQRLGDKSASPSSRLPHPPAPPQQR